MQANKKNTSTVGVTNQRRDIPIMVELSKGLLSYNKSPQCVNLGCVVKLVIIPLLFGFLFTGFHDAERRLESNLSKGSNETKDMITITLQNDEKGLLDNNKKGQVNTKT